MKQIIAVLLLASLLPGCWKPSSTNSSDRKPSAVAPDQGDLEGTSIQNELETNYERIVEGFKKNDPSVWESFLTPDFQLKLFNGTMQDRRWVSAYVRNNAKTFKV